MAHPLEKFLILQEKDRKIAKLRRELHDIPKRKDDVKTQLEGAKKRLEDTRNSLKTLTADLKQIEIDVESHLEKINKYKQQQMEAKNNEQYRAMLNQIATEQREITAREDQEIELMEKAEAVKKSIKKCETTLAEEKAAISEELKALEERFQEVQEDLDLMVTARSQMTSDIQPTLLFKYDRLFANKGDFAVVEVKEKHCSGCYMLLPPQVINDALNPKKLTICNFCGRMLINQR